MALLIVSANYHVVDIGWENILHKCFYISFKLIFSPQELYQGDQNPFIKTLIISGEFTCDFDSIKNYPFGDQNCTFTFFLRETGVLRAQNISYIGDTMSGQYKVAKNAWTIVCFKTPIGEYEESEQLSMCNVWVLLRRDLFRQYFRNEMKFHILICYLKASMSMSKVSKIFS